jgi:hypothetical protein
MKTRFLILTLFLTIGFTSCKKELIIDVDKTYVEEGATAGSLGFGGIILTLMPGDKADFLNSGDVVERGAYTINGSNVVLKINSREYKFKVISETELRYDKTRVLKLDQR